MRLALLFPRHRSMLQYTVLCKKLETEIFTFLDCLYAKVFNDIKFKLTHVWVFSMSSGHLLLRPLKCFGSVHLAVYLY